MTPGIAAGVVLLLLIAALVAQPLRQRRSAAAPTHTSTTGALESLLFARESALAAIQDLQLDREMGKISDEDFALLDPRYRAEAIEVLRRLDALGLEDEREPDEARLEEWIDLAVAAARQSPPAAR